LNQTALVFLRFVMRRKSLSRAIADVHSLHFYPVLHYE